MQAEGASDCGPMKLFPKILVVPIAIGSCAVAWIGWKFTPWGELQYVRHRTGIELPAFPSDLFVFDDAEMSITVHARLPPDQVAKTLATSAFRAAEREPSASPSLPSELFRAEKLPVAYRQLPPGARTHRADGCGNGTSWTAILDDVSGAIWIQVLYPDWSGDKPSCP